MSNEIYGISLIILGLVLFLKPEMVLFKDTSYETVNKISKYINEYNKVAGGILIGCGYYIYTYEYATEQLSTSYTTKSIKSSSDSRSFKPVSKSSSSSVGTSELPDVKSSELFE